MCHLLFLLIFTTMQIHRYKRMDTSTHASTDPSRTMHQHAQIWLPSNFWILFLMLIISMSPKFCNGTCANVSLISSLPSP